MANAGNGVRDAGSSRGHSWSGALATDGSDGHPSPVNEYPVVNTIRTHVMKFGEVAHKGLMHDVLILMIPGNPGAIEFNEDFMRTMHTRTGLPVWGLSHAGHCIIPSTVPWTRPKKEVYTLDGQVEHKLDFIRCFVPPSTRLILVGHSMGSHVILEMLRQLPVARVLKAFLLFPTVERMAVSPRGRQLLPVLRRWWWLLVGFAFLVSLLPLSWKQSLLTRFLSFRRHRLPQTGTATLRAPACFRQGVMNILDASCVWNCLDLARIEMDAVDELDVEHVREHAHKLVFYYGATDWWCPVDYYHDMRARLPEHGHNIHLCQDGFRHAFIFDASVPMGEKVAAWIHKALD